MAVFCWTEIGTGAGSCEGYARPHFFFQVPLNQRQVKQTARQSQSAVMAHQTPFAPQPKFTQRIWAKVRRNTAMEVMLTHMGKVLSLAARSGPVRTKDGV